VHHADRERTRGGGKDPELDNLGQRGKKNTAHGQASDG
jgi:hypothetical protein